MKIIGTALGGMLGVFLLFSGAIGEEFPIPKVDYSADMEMKAKEGPGGKPVRVIGKVYASRDKERREMTVEGQESVMITRRDKMTVWVLIKDEKMYIESSLDEMDNDPERMMKEGKVKLTPVGSEKINGVSAKKYRVESKDEKGHHFDGHLWVTDKNIPVRIAGASEQTGPDEQFQIDYTNIVVKKQDPGLFEVPSGYKKMAMPQMPAMGRMPEGGMTKEQMQEQMEEMMKQMQKQGMGP
jgi:hypothetical protein